MIRRFDDIRTQDKPMNHDTPSPCATSAGKKKGVAHLWSATLYTANGLKALCHETAFRHEMLAGCLILPAALLLPFPLWQALILNLLWGGVLVVEALNTALEAVVDLVSPGYHPLAKKAKDLGSAAVGLSLAVNVLAWGAGRVVAGRSPRTDMESDLHLNLLLFCRRMTGRRQKARSAANPCVLS